MPPLQRLLPDPAELTPAEATTDLRLGDLAPPDRPYVVLNMIATADGRATIEGRTRALGGELDQAVFHGLRTQADAVMAGAGTARIENYGKLVKSPELRARRETEGLEPEPVACLISGDLNLPGQMPLLQDPDSVVLVATAAEGEIAGVRARVEYLRMANRSLRPVLEHLRGEYRVASVLCEGGPTLNGSLLAEDLVDELFLTISPELAGGHGPLTIVEGLDLDPPRPLELRSCIAGGGCLFLRYGVARGGAVP